MVFLITPLNLATSSASASTYNKMVLFRKDCSKCGKLFRPTGKCCRMCEDCRDKALRRGKYNKKNGK